MGKQMKIAIALLVWSLLLTGCSAEPSSTQSVAELYQSAAEELVAAEDFPGALAVLDEGIANTDDPGLRQYAEEVRALQKEAENANAVQEEAEAPEDAELQEENTPVPPSSAEGILSPADGRKTSDFLAELGVDEASFRAQCQPVYDVTQGEFLCLEALQADPDSYAGQACYIAQDIPSGTMKPLTVVSQNVSSDGYPYYEIDGNILLWDVRDDPTAPAVTSGDVIYGYLLFDGIQSVDNTPYLSFFLISLEQAF